MARQRDAIVIEDCAQAFLATRQSRLVGTIGDVGCFSFQQGKHITSGEGGVVITDDDHLAREVRLFINKSWPYGEQNADHRKLGLNYRITELQSAVLVPQLLHLKPFVEHRRALASYLNDRLQDIPGLQAPSAGRGDMNSYWRYPLMLDPGVLPDGLGTVSGELRSHGIATSPRYIGKPAFQCGVFAQQETFGTSRWPFTLATADATNYSPEKFPGTFSYLESVLVLPWNERFTYEHMDLFSELIHKAVGTDESQGGEL